MTSITINGKILTILEKSLKIKKKNSICSIFNGDLKQRNGIIKLKL